MLFLAKILDIIPNWVYAILLVLAGLYMVGQGNDIRKLENELTDAKTELASEKNLRAQEKLLAASENQRIALQIRASTQLFKTSLEDLTNAYENKLRKRDLLIDSLRRDGKLYRDDIRNFSSSAGNGATSTEGALLDCKNRVATIGDILERTDDFAERVTLEAETRIEQVRVLQEIVSVLENYVQSFSKNFETVDSQ